MIDEHFRNQERPKQRPLKYSQNVMSVQFCMSVQCCNVLMCMVLRVLRICKVGFLSYLNKICVNKLSILNSECRLVRMPPGILIITAAAWTKTKNVKVGSKIWASVYFIGEDYKSVKRYKSSFVPSTQRPRHILAQNLHHLRKFYGISHGDIMLASLIQSVL